MKINKKLVMQFKTEGDKKISINIDNPREDITEEEIKTVMTSILSKNVFSVNGEDLASLVGAKIVETGTTDYDLVLF